MVTIGTAFISDCFSNEIQFSLSFWWIQLQQLSDQAHNEHRIPTNVAELQREANITWDWTLLQRDSGVIKFCHMVQLIEIKKPGQCGASANYRDTEWVTMRVHAAEVMQRRDTNGMIKLLNSSHLKRQQVSKALPLAEVSPRPIRLSSTAPRTLLVSSVPSSESLDMAEEHSVRPFAQKHLVTFIHTVLYWERHQHNFRRPFSTTLCPVFFSWPPTAYSPVQVFSVFLFHI